MGKNKRANAGVKIPKEIAGIKIPKKLRKKGETIIEAAQSPIGREVMLSGLAAMASAAITRGMARTTPAAPPTAPPPAPATPPPGQTGRIDPTEAGAEAARQFLNGLGEAFRRMRDQGPAK